MAELKAQKRNKLPSKSFAIPSERKYPIHDEAHAKNALARVTQYGTPEERKKVRAAVCNRYPNLPACQEAPKGTQSKKNSK